MLGNGISAMKDVKEVSDVVKENLERIGIGIDGKRKEGKVT